MRIDNIKIDGIANIEQANLRIAEQNALIAPNGYGKSNVLHAIEFGMGFLAADEAQRRQMMRSRWLPINTEMRNRDFSFDDAE